MMIQRTQITGLVLAGGRGSRMGGLDKGLQMLAGKALVQHAIERLAPQVAPLLVSANRNLDIYAAFGHPVLPDAQGAETAYPGPLAGMLAGLDACTTPYLATVPCDCPALPTNLVARLAQALHAAGAQIALPTTSGAVLQPMFCLMQAGLHASLLRFVQSGQGQAGRWATQQHCVTVPFDDEPAFFNANTLKDLESLQ